MVRAFLLISMCCLNSIYANGHGEEESKEEIIPVSLKFLNPAKGWTVWADAPVEETFTWMSYGMNETKIHKEFMASGYEITVTDFSHIFDYSTIVKGVHAWNKEKLLESELWNVSIPGIKGVVQWDRMELTIKSPECFADQLEFLEQEAFLRGVTRSYVELENYPQMKNHSRYRGTNKVAAKLLQSGYRLLRGTITKNFVTGTYDSVFYKPLTLGAHKSSRDGLEVRWKQPKPIELLETLDCFGVYFRNEDGHTIGGMWGSIMAEAVVPHAYIDFFFMDETVRGKGYGKMIMAEAEKYVSSKGFNKILLTSSDHQAPWFYEKAGFERVQQKPQVTTLKNGKLGNGYTYLKVL